MSTQRLPLVYNFEAIDAKKEYIDILKETLCSDLDFQNQNSAYSSHNVHSFPAKFPPQLPAKFIHALTQPGEVVLDPMSGSGTSILEAYFAARRSVGFDIDPLALKIAEVKTTRMNPVKLFHQFQSIKRNAEQRIQNENHDLERELANRWDAKTKEFVDYWFARETQIELLALVSEISKIQGEAARAFFEIALSAIIITKSGGVSLAFDLAHTRPHKAKVVVSREDKILTEAESSSINPTRLKFLTKKLRSPIEEFEKKCIQNLKSVENLDLGKYKPEIKLASAQKTPLSDSSIDLIVTSPPYASNAIDYMRAHKFSLVWLGHRIDDLSLKRKKYIGGEVVTDFQYEALPKHTTQIISEISSLDVKKGKVLRRYYSEMKRTLKEMHRVLKPGKSAIVVVGSSIMRGKDTETQNCLADIGKSIGFEVPKIGVRKIDRDKRMMPASVKGNAGSQIQKRMHEEYVIGFYKPEVKDFSLVNGKNS